MTSLILLPKMQNISSGTYENDIRYVKYVCNLLKGYSQLQAMIFFATTYNNYYKIYYCLVSIKQ